MSDSESDLSIEARAHLQRLKSAPSGPHDAARERMRARLTAALGDAMVPTEQVAQSNAAPGTADATLGRIGMSAGFVKGALLGAVLRAAAGAGVEHAWMARTTVPIASVQSAPVSAMVASPVAPAVPPIAEASEPVVSTSPSQNASKKPALEPHAASAASSERERLAVETARQALLRRDADSARQALADHERAFPQGALVEERDSLAIRAALLANDLDSARRRLVRFEQRYPQSLFTPALRQAVRVRALGEP